jgi:predicted lipoprotein with Yx(FWY)xxD motif
MSKSAPAAQAPPRTPARRRRAWLGLAALVLVALASLAAVALAAGSALTLNSASNSTLGKSVLVNPQGRTLYRLSPETSKHLLCKSKECLGNWPPLTVKSASTKLRAGSGVKGKLAILRRSNGSFQVTLNGMPLYRFAGDTGKDQDNGEGIESFGGTWHAVIASGSAGATKPTSTTPTMPTSTEPAPAPYNY